MTLTMNIVEFCQNYRSIHQKSIWSICCRFYHLVSFHYVRLKHEHLCMTCTYQWWWKHVAVVLKSNNKKMNKNWWNYSCMYNTVDKFSSTRDRIDNTYNMVYETAYFTKYGSGVTVSRHKLHKSDEAVSLPTLLWHVHIKQRWAHWISHIPYPLGDEADNKVLDKWPICDVPRPYFCPNSVNTASGFSRQDVLEVRTSRCGFFPMDLS